MPKLPKTTTITNKHLKSKIEKTPYPVKAKFHHSTFKHAWQGLNWAYNTQPNLKIDIIFTALLFYLNLIFWHVQLLNPIQFFITMLLCFLLVSVELFNTSIEALSDQVAQGEYKEFIRIAKDTAAAAVFVIFTFATVAGLTIYIPIGIKILNLLF